MSFTKHNGNHSENTATFCNISGFFFVQYEMWRKLAWNNDVLKQEFTVVSWHCRWNIFKTLQIQVSLYYRVRHPNNYSKMTAARAAHDLLSERGAEKKKRISPPISRWPLSSVYNFFFSFLFFVNSSNVRFHLLTFRRCSQLVPNTLDDLFSVLLPISKPLTQTHFPMTFFQSCSHGCQIKALHF